MTNVFAADTADRRCVKGGIRRLTRRAALALGMFSALSAAPGSAENLLYQDGQIYTDATEALAAVQRDLDKQLAGVAPAAAPLPGRLLVVLPDRDQVSHMPQPKRASEVGRNFDIDSEQAKLRANAQGIVKAHIAEQTDIVERNYTVVPAFVGYDYVIWGQVNPYPNRRFRWQMRKRGVDAALAPMMRPVCADGVISELVAAMRRGLDRLTTESAETLPPPSEQLPVVVIRAPYLFPVFDMTSQFEEKARVRIGMKPRACEEVRPDFRTCPGWTREPLAADDIASDIAGFDILIADSEAVMDDLARDQRIVPDSRHDLVADRLVLVVPADQPGAPVIAAGMPVTAPLGDGKLALSDPDKVPSAAAAKQALSALGLWGAVSERLLPLRGPLASTILGAGGRRLLTLVAHHQAAATIVYGSETSPCIRTVRTAASFPEGTYPTRRYAIAIVAGHDSPTARAALNFLLADGRAMLVEHFGYRAP